MFWQVTIDANDPVTLARFWRQALGYQAVPPRTVSTAYSHYSSRLGADDVFDDRIFDPEGAKPPVWFQKVPEVVAGKNRLHLDLYVTGRDDALTMSERTEIVEAKVAALVALGATVQQRESIDNRLYWVIMQDPEGNVFCVG